ncbi:MAG: hypothetical protein AAF598_00410 [Bacteroidota bacterium]
MNREEARALREERAKQQAREAGKEGRKLLQYGIIGTVVLLALLYLTFRANAG